jgi:hypothetical protein
MEIGYSVVARKMTYFCRYIKRGDGLCQMSGRAVTFPGPHVGLMTTGMQ